MTCSISADRVITCEEFLELLGSGGLGDAQEAAFLRSRNAYLLIVTARSSDRLLVGYVSAFSDGEGRLPAVIPDMATLKRTHDVPVTTIVPAALMAVPIVLSCGTRCGVLCSLKSTPMLELDERHRRRQQMSAQHIAQLVDEAR